MKRLLLIVCLIALSACGGKTQPEPSPRLLYENNLALWQAQKLKQYQVDFRISCFCTQEWTAKKTLHVKNGKVTAIFDTATGNELSLTKFPDTPSIEAAFASIDSLLDQKLAKLIVEYHPSLGYPTLIAVDRDVRIADEEYSWHFENLQ